MNRLILTQRVDVVEAYGERRDALDQRWTAFARAIDLVPIPVPNDERMALDIVRACDPAGIILTGGNTLAALGGGAAERDATETALLHHAIDVGIPVLGVCRGMQVIQSHFGVPLVRVEGHVAKRLPIVFSDGARREVNSFHDFGTAESVDVLHVGARAADGVVKAVRHSSHRIVGIMWHPERETPFREEDLRLARELFRRG